MKGCPKVFKSSKTIFFWFKTDSQQYVPVYHCIIRNILQIENYLKTVNSVRQTGQLKEVVKLILVGFFFSHPKSFYSFNIIKKMNDIYQLRNDCMCATQRGHLMYTWYM